MDMFYQDDVPYIEDEGKLKIQIKKGNQTKTT